MTATLQDQIVHDFSPGRIGKVDALMDSANRLGQEAKEAAVQRLVRPALQVARQATEAIEDHARQTSTRVQDALADLEDKALDNPRRSLGVALAVGVVIGLWLHRR